MNLEGLRTFVNWLALLGIPTIFSIVMFLVKGLIKTIKSIDILQRAQKAQMRSQMLLQYEHYMEQGYIEQIYLDDWLNQFKAYHELVGENEVLDKKKEQLLELPNKPA